MKILGRSQDNVEFKSPIDNRRRSGHRTAKTKLHKDQQQRKGDSHDRNDRLRSLPPVDLASRLGAHYELLFDNRYVGLELDTFGATRLLVSMSMIIGTARKSVRAMGLGDRI